MRSWLARHPATRALVSSPTGLFAITLITAIAILGAVAPVFFDHAANALDFSRTSRPPSGEHLLGTDPLGRDVLARLLVATGLSLRLGLSAAGIALAAGVTLGLVAALAPPVLRGVTQRTIDTCLSFPYILTAIFLSTIIGIGVLGAVVGVGIAISFYFARVTSTLAQSVAREDYVNAARALGLPRRTLIGKYILPNVAPTLVISASVTVSSGIVAVSALSFLGLGVQAPAYDWGRLLTDGVKSIYSAPAAAVGPAAAIAIVAIAFGLLGEALTHALNPLVWSETSREHTVAPAAARVVPADAREDSASLPNAQVLEVDDLTVSFIGPGGRTTIVQGVSVAVGRGEMVGVVGESGSGKTMTALGIIGLVPFPGQVSGTVRLLGTDVATLSTRARRALYARALGVVFQDPWSSLNPTLKLGTQVSLAARAHMGLRRRAARRLAVERFREVRLRSPEWLVRRYPHELSGGMRQRATIAAALMSMPSLLIADEPTTALDVTVQAQVMGLLQRINDDHNTAIVLISHNLALVSQYCDRVLVMYAGRVVEDIPVEQLVRGPLHPYARALVSAVPKVGHAKDQPLEQIPGEVPDLSAPPSGCPYHPRCPLAVLECSTTVPRLTARPEEPSHRVACHVVNAEAAS